MRNRVHSIGPIVAFPVMAMLLAIPASAQYPPTIPGQPQPTFSDEVTVTATGVETAVDDAPTAVTVVTRDEIDDLQSGSVADMLRRVPGLSVIASGDAGKVTSVFTRGTASNQTLVMLDGVRLNSPYFGGYDLSNLSTNGLSQIEVARGPYSALWGADAVGGVINLIPVRAKGGFNGRFFGEGGNDGWQRLEADIGWGSKSFDIYASGFDRRNDGELENSDYKNRQILLTAGYRWGIRNSRIGVLVQDLESETGIPYATPGSPTPDRRQESNQRLIAMPIDWWLSEKWNIDLTLSRVNGEFQFSDPDDPLFPYSETETTSTQARFASNHMLGGHTFSWGGEWREEEVTDSSIYGTNLDREKIKITSFLLQDMWKISPDVRLLVGMRWDEAEEWGSEVSPRGDLGWQITPNLEFRAGYGEGFRPPSVGELYYPFAGNPELEAETSSSTDFGLAYITKGRRAKWAVTAFSTKLDNLIEYDFASSTNINIGTAKIRGAELSWDHSLGRRGASLMQATYLDTENDLGDPLLRRPEWSGSWTIHGAFSSHFTGDLAVIYVGARWDVDPTTFVRSENSSYTTGNISLAYSIWDGVEITGRVLNVMGKEYEEVLGYPAQGRRWMFGLRLGVDTPERWQRNP